MQPELKLRNPPPRNLQMPLHGLHGYAVGVNFIDPALTSLIDGRDGWVILETDYTA